MISGTRPSSSERLDEDAMSITKCKKCGGSISTEAVVCSWCGYRTRMSPIRNVLIYLALLSLILLAFYVVWLPRFVP